MAIGKNWIEDLKDDFETINVFTHWKEDEDKDVSFFSKWKDEDIDDYFEQYNNESY